MLAGYGVSEVRVRAHATATDAGARRRARRRLAASATVLLAGAALLPAADAGSAARPLLSFRVYADTGYKLDSILWTGTRFLLDQNTQNTLWSAPAAGAPLQHVADMPVMVEETRCVLSPGTHGYPAGVVFCHAPDDKIYEITQDGSSVTVFATLPASAGGVSDGALAFDGAGRFGFQMLAATGRSGAGQPPGGALYAVDPSGRATQVATYPGPGGADELLVAPLGLGSVGGDALLTVDAGATSGALDAIDAQGREHTVAALGAGLNPIAVVPPPTAGRPGSPPAGLYVTNDVNNDLYFAPASDFAGDAGDLVVGAENSARFWILAPRGGRFAEVAVRSTLRGGHYSLEGCTFVN